MNRMKLKSIFAAVLCAAILSSPAHAAELTFRDVPEDAWYYADVQAAVDTGLVNGRSAEAFCPDDYMTAAEAVKLAACMHVIRSADAEQTAVENGDPWYAPWADYAKENGIIDGDYDWNEPISRGDYMAIFARALPEDGYAVKNEIPDGTLPDVAADDPRTEAIYKLARAGIVEGDEQHRIKPEDPIKRCEVAAILTRMMNEDARKSFTLAEETVRAADFSGIWMDRTSGRATLTVMASEEYPFYDVTLIWGSGAASSGVWNMKASFDEAEGRLVYENGTMAYVNFDENGTQTRDERWNDGVGSFALEADGTMSWEDSREERSTGFVLERTLIPAPSPEELADGWFRLIGGIESGTAGSSLKRAQAVCDAVGFASRNEIWAADMNALRENLLSAWLSMTDEERSAFDENFIDVLSAVRDARADWDANKGPFEDAGVSETVRGFFATRSSMLSWDALTANTLTMGNTPGK